MTEGLLFASAAAVLRRRLGCVQDAT